MMNCIRTPLGIWLILADALRVLRLTTGPAAGRFQKKKAQQLKTQILLKSCTVFLTTRMRSCTA